MMKHCSLLLLLVAAATTLDLAAGQDWWPTVQSTFGSTVEPELKRCKKRLANPPVNNTKCGKKEKTCFFAKVTDNTCGPDAFPDWRCACTIKPGNKRGTWICNDEPCPEEEEEEEEEVVVTVDDPAPATGFQSSLGRAFDVRMNLLTNDVLSGYETVEELCDDLNMTVRFFMNAFIDQQSRYTPPPVGIFTLDNEPAVAEFSVVQADVAQAQPVSSPSAAGTTDFETNNQEEGVDEADMVKSDGVNVYAVYGDQIVIWDALSGDPVANYTLPPLADTNTNTGGGGGGGGDFLIADAVAFYPYKPKPSIRGMSLEAGRLVLYVQGYGNEVRAATAGASTSTFSNAFDTRITVLDTSSLPAINVITNKDVHGTYRDARAIGDDNIHVVTTCNINFYKLQAPLYRWKTEFQKLNDTEYVAAAAAIAAPLIDEFVTSLKNDVILLGMPNIPKLSIWQTDLGNNTNIVEDIYSGGAIRAFVQISSFNVAGLTGDLDISTSGAFTPSSWGYTYAVDGNLVFAAQGYNWNPWFGGSAQTTYLLGFKLNGASATPSFIGSVPGYINNQYYLNIYNGTLSVATTVTSWWPVWTPPPEEDTDVVVWPQRVFTTNNTVYVFNLPTETEPMTEAGRVENLGKPGERFTAVRFFRNICYAVTFRQIDPFYVVSTDPTDVRLLGELEITGFSSYMHSINADDTLLVGVGQEADATGRVLGVQISLFDASTPSAPTLVDRLVVEQETDVWSSSNVQWDYKAFRYLPLGPEVGVIIIPLQVRSWSQSNLDGNFDGFLAYDVSRVNGISQRLNVTHVATSDFYGCYYRANLPQRSMVFNGNVTTMKGHSVISTDLDTGEQTWKYDMAKPVEKNDCGYWFW